MDRRQFAALAAAAASARLLSACGSDTTEPPPDSQGEARLLSRPSQPTQTVSPGNHQLGLDQARDGVLYVPSRYLGTTPVPFVVAFHGAGGTAISQIDLLGPYAEDRVFIVLAIDSRAFTWDGVQQKFGPDVAFIDRALQYAFDRCVVDPNHVVVAGVSDGATYAISHGLANGDLFKRVVAFSPGGIIESSTRRNGHPEFFISHGTDDRVIPVSRSRNGTVPTLRSDGYTVEYDEFTGGHEVPAAVAQAAVDWFLR